MKTEINFGKMGKFQISSVSAIGQLTLNGYKSQLMLSCDQFYQLQDNEKLCIHGILDDNKRVSLIDCITSKIPGVINTENGRIYSASVFPHYVVTGIHHFDPEDSKVKAVQFTLRNASALFWDVNAFGWSHTQSKNTAFLQDIFATDGANTEIGDYPCILYFTGKEEILSAKTDLGTVSARHRPTFTSPSPSGISVRNRIPVRIEFDEPLTFKEALGRKDTLYIFLEIIMGGKQLFEDLAIEIESESDNKTLLDVYHTMDSCLGDDSSDTPHPGDVLINAGINPSIFSTVLSKWINLHHERRDARFRFIQSFRYGREYDIDRLVSAANIFDILPTDATGKPNDVPRKLLEAKEEARRLFKILDPCQERDSILGALRRIGEHNLKTKVKYRAKSLIELVGDKLPDLELVINLAIDARNYYVHGSPQKLSPDDYYEFLDFFTDALEFIFAVSELIEAGWDIVKWISKPKSLSHPFGRFLLSYREHLVVLQSALIKQRKDKAQIAPISP